MIMSLSLSFNLKYFVLKEKFYDISVKKIKQRITTVAPKLRRKTA